MAFLFILSSASLFSQNAAERFITYEKGQKIIIEFQIYGDDLDKASVKLLKTGATLKLDKIKEKELQRFEGGQSVFQIEFEQADKKGKYIIFCQGAVIDKLIHLSYDDKEVTLFNPETEE